jgi:signal transduction histidine kinase
VSEYQRQRDAELSRHLNEHFAFVAHELRNPLSSSLSALGMLERTGGLDKSGRFAQVLTRNLNRLHELIDSSLRSAQLATGVELELARFTLSDLLADMEVAATANAEHRGVALTFQVENDVTIYADARLVRSALSNLVHNAVKFSHEGGHVTVRARGGDEHVLLEVEDSCGGLPPGAVERLFAPFAQLGADRSGFGLGLAIAKQAADAHHGVIRVQDLPGVGCIFVLELPISAADGRLKLAPLVDPNELPPEL